MPVKCRSTEFSLFLLADIICCIETTLIMLLRFVTLGPFRRAAVELLIGSFVTTVDDFKRFPIDLSF
jgi:hypothetical protein